MHFTERARLIRPVWAVLGLTLISALVSVILINIFGFHAICTDCMSRSYFSFRFWQEPDFFQVTSWLPAHMALFGSSLHTGWDMYTVFHGLNVTASALLLPLMWGVSRQLGVSASGQMWLLGVAALGVMRNSMAVSLLSEPGFVAMAVLWLYFLQKPSAQGVRIVALSVLSVLMSAHRVQAWVLIPVTLLWACAENMLSRRWAVIVWALSLIFPIVFLVVSAQTYGSAFYPFAYFREDAQAYWGQAMPSNAFAFESLLRYFPWLLVLPPALVLTWQRLTVRQQRFAVGALAYFAFEVYVMWNQVPTIYPARTIYLSGLMLSLAMSTSVGVWLIDAHTRRMWVLAGLSAVALMVSYTVAPFQENYKADLVTLGRRIRAELQSRGKSTFRVGADLSDGVDLMTLQLGVGQFGALEQAKRSGSQELLFHTPPSQMDVIVSHDEAVKRALRGLPRFLEEGRYVAGFVR